MTHANSSTESFFYTSDDSHFHSHSQQTSEESAMYGEHPNEATAALNPSSDLIWPSSISADQAQTQYFPNHASNTSIVSTQMPLPSKGLFSEYDIQHARFQESWPGQSSNAISTILPVSYPKKAPTYEHETSQRQFSHSPQPRRVGSSYTFNDKGFIPSNSQLPLLSSTSSPETMANLSNQRERQDVYYTREESSFSSSSASESLGGTSDALTKQGKHDDGRPKRPLNAFMIFSRARRKDLVKEKPGMKVKDVSIALAEEWRNLEKVPIYFQQGVFDLLILLKYLSALSSSIYSLKRNTIKNWPRS